MVVAKTEYEHDLLEAVKEGKIRTVQKILNHDDIDYLKDARYFDYYLVVKALGNSNLAIAKFLIDKGCRVYKKSKCKDTVLHYAVLSKDIDLVTSLLAKGALRDILTRNEEKETPFHLAIDRNQSCIVELFLDQFDIFVDVKYFLQYAIQKHNISFSLTSKENETFKILEKLLSYFSVISMKPNGNDDTTLVYNASISGNLKNIKKYIDSGFPMNTSLKLNANSWPCLHSYSGFTLLHFAVKHVKIEVVQFLLNKGADIFAKNENGSTPLHLAFENKELGIWETWKKFDQNNSIMDLILKINAKYNFNPMNKHGLSHFHIACSRDEPAIVEHFFKLGASVNQPVSSECHLYKGFSPLHFAAKFRCRKTVELLLKNGADVKQRDYKEMTVLHIAAKESCPEVVSLLLQYGAGVDIASVDSCSKTPLHWAFENSNYGVMDLLLSASNIIDSNPTDSQGISHFHIACTRNNVNVVKKFIERGVSIDACVPAYSSGNKLFQNHIVNWSEYSPLHFAVRYNKAEIVQVLLDSGANVRMKNSRGFAAYHISCKYNYEKFANFFENLLCGLKKYHKTSLPFHSLTDVVKVDEKRVNFNESIENIDWSSNRSEHLQIINALFQNKIDVDCMDKHGNTSLFWAYCVIKRIVYYTKEKLESLGCSKALLDQIAESLSEELRERRKLIVDHFLKLDANLDKCSGIGSIWHCIAVHPNVEFMELNIKGSANVNAKNYEMNTPLYYAVMHENTNAVRMLLNYNADTECTESEKNLTPLLIASNYPSERSFEIIKLLADHGANVDARRPDGTTALHKLASYCTDEDVARETREVVEPLDAIVSTMSALIDAGANVNARDSNGLTPLHAACEATNYQLFSALLEYGADVENKRGRSICSCLYGYEYTKWLYCFFEQVGQMVKLLQTYVVKMMEIGLPISENTLLSLAKCADMVRFSGDRLNEEKKALVDKCRAEVTVLKDTKIYDNCTLFDAIFKNENTLSYLVKNPVFQDIVKSEPFEKKYSNYGYLVKLKYRTGVQRAKLLPAAKSVLGDLAGLHLPDTCSENICKYFENFELKESIEMLRGILNSKMENSGDTKLKFSETSKRQKVN